MFCPEDKGFPAVPGWFVTVIAFLSYVSAFGQEKIWTKQSKLSEVVMFENAINPSPHFLSESVELSKDYYPLVDKYQVTNPLTVQREPVGYVPLYAQYYFTPGDSILRVISYDWEKDEYGNFFDKQKIWAAERKRFDNYNQEYERVRSILIA